METSVYRSLAQLFAILYETDLPLQQCVASFQACDPQEMTEHLLRLLYPCLLPPAQRLLGYTLLAAPSPSPISAPSPVSPGSPYPSLWLSLLDAAEASRDPADALYITKLLIPRIDGTGTGIGTGAASTGTTLFGSASASGAGAGADFYQQVRGLGAATVRAAMEVECGGLPLSMPMPLGGRDGGATGAWAGLKHLRLHLQLQLQQQQQQQYPLDLLAVMAVSPLLPLVGSAGAGAGTSWSASEVAEELHLPVFFAADPLQPLRPFFAHLPPPVLGGLEGELEWLEEEATGLLWDQIRTSCATEQAQQEQLQQQQQQQEQARSLLRSACLRPLPPRQRQQVEAALTLTLTQHPPTSSTSNINNIPNIPSSPHSPISARAPSTPSVPRLQDVLPRESVPGLVAHNWALGALFLQALICERSSVGSSSGANDGSSSGGQHASSGSSGSKDSSSGGSSGDEEVDPVVWEYLSVLLGDADTETDADAVPSKNNSSIINSNSSTSSSIGPGTGAGMTKITDTTGTGTGTAGADTAGIGTVSTSGILGVLSSPSIEAVSTLMECLPAQLPPAFLRRYTSRCLSLCESVGDKSTQMRYVRLLCAFTQSLIRTHPPVARQLSAQIQCFCLGHSQLREAALLFRLIRAEG